MTELLPLFLNLTGRDVLLVGGGHVAEAKLRQLVAVEARVRLVAPAIAEGIHDVARDFADAARVDLVQREFNPSDLDGVWLVVAAATPDVNRAVAEAAEARRLFVNAVDDPANASAFLSGVVRREGVTIAISTSGDAPALTALVREALDAVLPRDLDAWVRTAREQRIGWRRHGVPMEQRKPKLLQALNDLYHYAGPHEAVADPAEHAPENLSATSVVSEGNRDPRDPNVPWLSGPEDTWL